MWPHLLGVYFIIVSYLLQLRRGIELASRLLRWFREHEAHAERLFEADVRSGSANLHYRQEQKWRLLEMAINSPGWSPA